MFDSNLCLLKYIKINFECKILIVINGMQAFSVSWSKEQVNNFQKVSFVYHFIKDLTVLLRSNNLSNFPKKTFLKKINLQVHPKICL